MEPQSAGAGLTRDMLIIPEAPALLPPEKVKSRRNAVQLMNVAVAVPTGTVFGAGGEASNNPPVVSNSVIGKVRAPAVYAA